MKKLAAAQMWLPILHHEDGYGLTYGARVSFVDVLGDRSRVSVPMTWGGERRVALEARARLRRADLRWSAAASRSIAA